MSNLKILLKNNLNLLLGRLQGKKKRKSTNVAIALLVLGIIGIFALYSLQAWSMFDGLGKLGLGKLCVFHGIITALTTILIIGVMRVTGKTRGNDSDFLLSLPIKKRDIILSKLINQYLFDLFFSFVLLMPFVVMYEITAPAFSAPVLIFGTLTVFALPLLSVGISQIMEFVVVKLFNRIKIGNVLKSLVPTVIYIALIVLMLIKTTGYGTVSPENLEGYFADRWLSNQILTFIFDQKLLSILVFVALTVIPATIGVFLQINIYGKNFGTYSSSKQYVELKKEQKPFVHLLKKEVKNHFATPAYLVNTIIGPIMIVVASVVISILGIDVLKNLIGISTSNLDMAFVFACVINLMISVTTISSVSISLEGNKFWFLRSSPISANQVFISKLFIPIIIVMPTILISSAIMGILLNSIVSALIIFGISLLFLLITDIVGIMINLWFPRLNWENETQVVKQSLSVLLSMVFNGVLAIIPVAIYLIFKIEIWIVALISVALYLAVFVLFTVLLFTKGKKIFNKLEQ